jgi:hypothetical protein
MHRARLLGAPIVVGRPRARFWGIYENVSKDVADVAQFRGGTVPMERTPAAALLT